MVDYGQNALWALGEFFHCNTVSGHLKELEARLNGNSIIKGWISFKKMKYSIVTAALALNDTFFPPIYQFYKIHFGKQKNTIHYTVQVLALKRPL